MRKYKWYKKGGRSRCLRKRKIKEKEVKEETNILNSVNQKMISWLLIHVMKLRGEIE